MKENIEPIDFYSTADILKMQKKSSYFSDIEWAMNFGKPFKTKTKKEHISLVMNSSKVQNAMKQLINERLVK